jgi:hypothetical protein
MKEKDTLDEVMVRRVLEQMVKQNLLQIKNDEYVDSDVVTEMRKNGMTRKQIFEKLTTVGKSR